VQVRGLTDVVYTTGLVFRRGRPCLGPGFSAEHEGLRRYGGLTAVAAVPPGRASRRVQYWSFSGVAEEALRDRMRALPFSYDLTVLPARPMGWERSKTYGHVHVSRRTPGAGFPELYRVLQGRAGFLVQDLRPGPTTGFAALITAKAGETVVVPPLLQHVTINLGATVLVVDDLVCREADDEYGQVRDAHGMAYYVRTDDHAVVNPSYRAVPALQRFDATAWSGRGPTFTNESLAFGASGFEWLCSMGAFASAFPDLWQRVAHLASPQTGG
jgi:oxalate decarboxylase/phosphoglucose isomerase-like protein (cupin superfamily)